MKFFTKNGRASNGTLVTGLKDEHVAEINILTVPP